MFDWLQKLLSDLWQHLIPCAVINEFQLGVRLRLGIYPKALKPGFHWKIPIIDVILTDIVAEDTKEVSPIYVTTLDGETIVVTPVIAFQIIDIEKWIVHTNEGHSNLYDLTGMVAADILTDVTWEECKKKTTLTKIKNRLNSKIEHMGVVVLDFGFKTISKCRVIITKM